MVKHNKHCQYFLHRHTIFDRMIFLYPTIQLKNQPPSQHNNKSLVYYFINIQLILIQIKSIGSLSMQSPTFSNSSKVDIGNKLSPCYRNKRIPSAQDNYSSGTLLPWNQSSHPNRINSCKKLDSPRNKLTEKKRKRSQNSSNRIQKAHNNGLNTVQSSQKLNCNCSSSNQLYLNQLLQLKQQYRQMKEAYQQLITETLKNKEQLKYYSEQNNRLTQENQKYTKENERIKNKLGFMEKEIDRIRRESYKLLEIQQFKSKKLEESLIEKQTAIRQYLKYENPASIEKKQYQLINEYQSAGQCTVDSNTPSNNLINVSQQQSYTFHAKAHSNNQLISSQNSQPKTEQIYIPTLSPSMTPNKQINIEKPDNNQASENLIPSYGVGHHESSQSLTLSNQFHEHQKTVSNQSQFISISLTSMMENQSQYRYELSTKRNTNNSNMIRQQGNGPQEHQNCNTSMNQEYSSITTNNLYAEYAEGINEEQEDSEINHTQQQQISELSHPQPVHMPQKSKKSSKIKNSMSGNHLQHHNLKILGTLNVNQKMNRNNGNKSSNDCNFKKFRKEMCKKLEVNFDEKHREMMLQQQPAHIPRTPLDRKTSKSQKGSKARLVPKRDDENYELKSSKKKISHK